MYHSVIIAFIASSVLLIGWAADAFSHHVHHHNDRQRWSTPHQHQSSTTGADHSDQWSPSSSSSALHAEMSDNEELPSASASSKIPSGENYSTLTLLEHMHLLNTNVHITSKDSNNSKRSDMIDFFTTTLGFGMDPKSIDSLFSNKGVVFVNAGPTQLHLNDDAEYCQKLDELRQQNELNTLSGGNGDKNVFEIGLRYNSLEELKIKLASSSSDRDDSCCSYDIVSLGDGRESIRITDVYDRVFVAREVMESNDDDEDAPTISSICQQKVICKNNYTTSEEQDEIVQQYAIPTSQTTCRGMDFIEFFVYVKKEDSEKTVEKIARFYDFFFDATTSVVNDGRSDIAIIAFGKIDDSGRAEQSMLFRAVVVDGSLSHHHMVHSEELGTGHHIAIYVGNCDEDFEVAASNCVDGGLLWVNSQFEDKVLDVESAMKCKQFQFKNIVDIESGETLYVLEHEIRSISHPLFPGGN